MSVAIDDAHSGLCTRRLQGLLCGLVYSAHDTLSTPGGDYFTNWLRQCGAYGALKTCITVLAAVLKLQEAACSRKYCDFLRF